MTMDDNPDSSFIRNWQERTEGKRIQESILRGYDDAIHGRRTLWTGSLKDCS